MLISTLKLSALPKYRSEVLEILRSILGPTEIQPGCLSCQIYELSGPEPATVLCEHWETEAALHEHLRSDAYRCLLMACELADRPPQFCFHHVARTQGIELVHQIRGRPREGNFRAQSTEPMRSNPERGLDCKVLRKKNRAADRP